MPAHGQLLMPRWKTLGACTFFEEDAFEKGILIPKHKTFISGLSMLLLQTAEILFIGLDRCFKLLNVFRPAFTKCSLRLSVALLALFRGGIDLALIRVYTWP